MGTVRNNILSLHPRRQHNFEQAAALAELFPGKFTHATSIYLAPWLVKLLKKVSPGRSGWLARRSYAGLPNKYVISLPGVEVKKLWWAWRRKGINYFNLNDAWQRAVLKRFSPPAICISYDGSSNLIFREWKNKATLILDLSIGLPQYRIKMLHGEKFKIEMLESADEFQKKLFNQYQEEVELADLILCGSEFVKDTITFFYPEFAPKCRILPYAADTDKFDFPDRQFSDSKDLKFVFIGTVGWRKGADLLLEVWREFVANHPECELHFFGPVDKEICLTSLPDRVSVHGSVESRKLIEYLKVMDVFVLPTTFEGSSLAVYQAMAMQLPIITTRNSGSVLSHGESCELVEVSDKNSLLAGLTKIFNNMEYREYIAKNAYALSRMYTWSEYKKRIFKILEQEGLTNS